MNISVKALTDAVTSKVGRQILVGQKHSPAIMFGAGVVGVVATVVLASRATLKMDEVIEHAQADLADAKRLQVVTIDPEYTEKDCLRDCAFIYAKTGVAIAKLYAPALAVGVLSIASLTGSHVVLTRRNVALTAAYAAVEKGFKEYRERVVEQYGEDKDRELRYGAEQREILSETKSGEPKVKIQKRVAPGGHSIYARFFDNSNKNFSATPDYNNLFLRCQQNYLNDKLRARGHVFLNDAYDALGMDRTTEGSVVGWLWNGDGDNYIDFGIWDEKNMEKFHDFITGREGAILLDFNVDGVVYDKI